MRGIHSMGMGRRPRAGLAAAVAGAVLYLLTGCATSGGGHYYYYGTGYGIYAHPLPYYHITVHRWPHRWPHRPPRDREPPPYPHPRVHEERDGGDSGGGQGGGPVPDGWRHYRNLAPDRDFAHHRRGGPLGFPRR